MRGWLNGLPTEYQMALVFGLFMLVCFFMTPAHPAFDRNLVAVLTALGSLAGTAMLHGGASRIWGKGDATKDLMGDSPK